MKKSISILVTATVLLFAVSAMAHEKVVVIPLTGKKTVNVANFTGAWQPSSQAIDRQAVAGSATRLLGWIGYLASPAPQLFDRRLWTRMPGRTRLAVRLVRNL